MGESGKTASGSNGGGWLRRLAPLVLLVAIALLVVSQGWHRYLTLEHIAENRDMLKTFIDMNYALTLAGYMLVYMATIALSLPGGVFLTLIGGFLFGWFVGGVTTLIAATAGAVVVFLVARTSLGEPLAARAGPWLGKLREGFQQDAMSYLLFLRLVPLFPFWLVNLAPALLGVPLTTYVVATVLGIIPGTFAFTFAGVGLDSVIEAQRMAYRACLANQGADGKPACHFEVDAGALVTPELLIAFGALGIVALIPVIIKKIRKRPVSA